MNVSTPRLQAAAWWLIVACAGVDAVWLFLWGWHLTWQGVLGAAVVCLALLLPMLLPRYRRDARLAALIRAALQLLLFTKVAAIVSYLVVATNAPLIDARLQAWDLALGFDWPAVHAAVMQRPWLKAMLAWAYASGLVQIGVLIALLALTGRTAQLAEFMLLFIVNTLVTVALSGPFPALGYAMPPHFEMLRSGAMQVIALGQTQGLISIPSLHAAIGVLLIHASRGLGGLQLPFVLLNLVMIASTPTEGGHYLVDVIAGVAMAVATIGALRRLQRAPADRELAPTRPLLPGSRALLVRSSASLPR